MANANLVSLRTDALRATLEERVPARRFSGPSLLCNDERVAHGREKEFYRANKAASWDDILSGPLFFFRHLRDQMQGPPRGFVDTVKWLYPRAERRE